VCWRGIGFLLLVFKKRLPLPVFEKSLIGLQLQWFIDYIAFAYGMHVYRLYGALH
jgi:hypothetical protein